MQGSYSHCSIECDTLNVGVQNLINPVVVGNEPKILLAGEAVHGSHFSTTHGAYESGQHQAEMLLNYVFK